MTPDTRKVIKKTIKDEAASIPTAFWQRMHHQLEPSAYLALQQALQQPPLTSLRLHPEKGAACTFEASQPIPWHPQGYFLPQRPSFVADPLFHAGAYYVQEASSMLLYQALDWSQNYRILDFCAAPGGKSTLLASAMSAESYLVANDVVPTRAIILKENMTRWGNAKVSVTSSSATAFAKSGALFDVIVVDAPCSGEGMFRKDAFARAQWSPDLVASCALRQREIVQTLLPCLAAGGTLIYSTCTYAPEENEAIMTWLLENSSLEPTPLPNLSRYGAEAISIAGIQAAAYRCYPHKFQGEGFFIAALKDTRAPQAVKQPKTMPPSLPKQRTKQGGRFLEQYLPASFLKHYSLQENKKNWQLVAHHAPALRGIKILQTGLPVAKPFGKGNRAGVNPLHGLAMMPQLAQGQAERLELNREQALRYLSRLELELATASQGWLLACYQDVPLGWLKASGGRVNNYYPLEWRIRKPLDTLL